MFIHHLQTAIEAAHTRDALAAARRALASAQIAGAISEAEHERLWSVSDACDAALCARRASRPPLAFGAGLRPSYFPERRPEPKRDRSKSWLRKRNLGRSSPLPPQLEVKFTEGESSVLRIVADECRDHGRCEITMAELAARAGMGRTWARQTIRRARHEGLITTEQQPQWRAKHKPTIIRIVSKEWLTWIARGPKRSRGEARFAPPAKFLIGVTKLTPTETATQIQSASRLKTGRDGSLCSPSDTPKRRVAPPGG